MTDTPETDHIESNLGNSAHPILLCFCRKLERERDAAIAERDALLQAIRNLRDTKGRYHTQQAFESLMTLLPTKQND